MRRKGRHEAGLFRCGARLRARCGAGLYYMLVDKGESKRTVNALTRRIVLSIALILLIVLAHKLGWIEFHGVTA